MSISDCDQAHAYEVIPTCAFRYALGRRTHIAYDVAHWLKRNWEKISLDDRMIITRELGEAIKEYKRGNRQFTLGNNCDADEWMRLWEKIKGEHQ